jgi:K+-sensing histidine kinase KdpD
MVPNMKVDACILVCVTVQKECALLISRGREQAEMLGIPLFILHVAPDSASMLGNPDASAALNTLFSLSREAGAEMSVIYSANVKEAIVTFAREHQAMGIVVGRSKKGDREMAGMLKRELPGVEIIEALDL